MDIWAWVHDACEDLLKEDNYRLAWLVDNISHLVCGNQHERVDGLMPEALMMVRKSNNPWLEVYLKHWWMQSRLLSRYEVKKSLPEAVDLLERASRDETRDCPQSVCVTQDVCVAYGLWDGPGFSEERLAVSKEALERITPEWSCFHCISAEYADALIDAGRSQEALDFCNKQVSQMENRTPEAGVVHPMRQSRVAALLQQERYEDALKLAQEAKNPYQGENQDEASRMEQALALVHLGRYEEAMDFLEDFKSFEHQGLPSYYWHLAMYHGMDKGGIEPKPKFLRTITELFYQFLEKGVYRRGMEIGFNYAKLAIKRGYPALATLVLDDIEKYMAELPKILDAGDQLAQIRQAVDATKVDESKLGEGPEAIIQILMDRGPKTLTEDDQLLQVFVDALDALGHGSHGIRILKSMHKENPKSMPVLGLLVQSLSANGRDHELESLVKPHVDSDDDLLFINVNLWMLQHYVMRTNDDAAEEIVDRLRTRDNLDPGPEMLNMAAEVKWRQGKPDDARTLLDLALENDLADEVRHNLLWNSMVVAAIQEDWQKYRQDAATIGFQFEEGSDMPEVHAGYVQIRYDGEEKDFELWAIRTGPVTAQIVHLRSPELPNHYQDVVVFDPLDLTPPSEDEGEEHTATFKHAHTLKQGGWHVYDICGLRPDQERVDQLNAKIEGLHGCSLVLNSGEYKIAERETDNRQPGLYMAVAIPKQEMAKELHALVTSEIADWPAPVVFKSLCKAANATDQLAAMEAIEQNWVM